MPAHPATARKKSPQRSGHRVDITVWQFVRVMVQLESVTKSRGGRSRGNLRHQPATPQQRPVYVDWRSAWQEVDRELKRLADSDAEAFSDLMMSQNVVLECRGRSQLNEVTRAIDNVVHQMRAEVRASTGDAEHISDLRYEIRELEKLAKKLSGVGRKKMAPASGKASGKTATDKPSATRPASAKPVTAKPATGKRGSAKAAPEKSATKKFAANKSAANRSAANRPAGGRPHQKRRAGRPQNS